MQQATINTNTSIVVVRGGRRLSGHVSTSGAKNAALPILIGTLLSDEDSWISNVPQLDDVLTTLDLLTTLGKKVTVNGTVIMVSSGSTPGTTAPYELVKKMRASVLVMGPLLARWHQAKVPLPGGCAIGSRPIDLHLSGIEKLGGKVSLERGYVKLESQELIGNRISLDYPSVGATENLMMAASLACGTTVIENTAMEPEICDLGNCLSGMGAQITGLGSRIIKITGVEKLHGVHHDVIPDRIETGTLLLGCAVAGGEVTVEKTRPEFLGATLTNLRKAGVHVQIGNDSISVSNDGRPLPTDVETAPYPGFSTDMQPQWMALESTGTGVSVVVETIFESRFMHAGELQRMGANIKIRGRNAIVRGVEKLSGAPVAAPDLRAAAALILAGLAADGETEISGVQHLDRGYEHLVEKLHSLGADIRRSK